MSWRTFVSWPTSGAWHAWGTSLTCVLDCLSVLAYFSYLVCLRYLAYFCFLGCFSVLAYFCVLAYFSYLVYSRVLGLLLCLGLLEFLGLTLSKLKCIFPNLWFSVSLMEIPLSLFFTHCRSCIPNNKTNAVKNVFISTAKFYRQCYSYVNILHELNAKILPPIKWIQNTSKSLHQAKMKNLHLETGY